MLKIAIATLRNEPELLETLRLRGYSHATKTEFHWDVIASQWKDILIKIRGES